jgi:hypothetical protein
VFNTQAKQASGLLDAFYMSELIVKSMNELIVNILCGKNSPIKSTYKIKAFDSSDLDDFIDQSDTQRLLIGDWSQT